MKRSVLRVTTRFGHFAVIDNVKLIAMEEAGGESLMMGWSIF